MYKPGAGWQLLCFPPCRRGWGGIGCDPLFRTRFSPGDFWLRSPRKPRRNGGSHWSPSRSRRHGEGTLKSFRTTCAFLRLCIRRQGIARRIDCSLPLTLSAFALRRKPRQAKMQPCPAVLDRTGRRHPPDFRTSCRRACPRRLRFQRLVKNAGMQGGRSPEERRGLTRYAAVTKGDLPAPRTSRQAGSNAADERFWTASIEIGNRIR